MKGIHFLFCLPLIGALVTPAKAQSAEELIRQVRARLDKVNDYEARGTLKTNVIFIKAPIARVRIFYKKPNKLRIHNESGISFIPKGSVNVTLNNIFVNSTGFDIIDVGKEEKTGLRIVKLLPKDESSEVVLSTLYIDETRSLVKKAKTTTKENGTYELELTYGKYADYGLADKIIFSFNTKYYKLPKGVSFDYDAGNRKEENPEQLKSKKGKIEIVYSSYDINKGVPDSIFN